MYVLVLSTSIVLTMFRSDKYLVSYARMSAEMHVMCPLLQSDFNQNWKRQQI
jgi:hypothetical protein